MKWFIKLLRWIWEFPQCLLGLILTKLYNVKYTETYNGIKVYTGNFPGGISLGLYILLSKTSYNNNYKSKLHEFGHTKQSLYLGPLYLLVIGIPSILWAGFINDVFFPSKSYYWFYTERWADKLGGVPKRY